MKAQIPAVCIPVPPLAVLLMRPVRTNPLLEQPCALDSPPMVVLTIVPTRPESALNSPDLLSAVKSIL